MPHLPIDTLRADTTLIRSLQEQYDYESRLESHHSWWGDMWIWVGRQLSHIDWQVVLWLSILTAVALVIWVVMYQRMGLFRRQRGGVDLQEAERDIHGIDFDREIDIALRQRDWTRASRLRYL